MAGAPSRRRRGVAVLLLAALLAVPAALRAHVHVDGTGTSPACAVCAVALHSPAIGASAVAPATPAVACERLAVSTAAPACREDAPIRPGRAPPLAPATSL